METWNNSAYVIQGTSRKCIASGELKDKSSLLRFVVTPDNMIVADVLEKLPGKGIWLGCDKVLLEKTVRDGLFARVTKKSIVVPETLLDDVEQMLTSRVISLISLARKSGRAVAGYEKVKDWLSKDLATVFVDHLLTEMKFGLLSTITQQLGDSDISQFVKAYNASIVT